MPGSSGRPVALVTGASGGIGRELAEGAARRGHDVVLVARSQELLAEVAAKIATDHGVITAAVTADLSQPAGIDALVTELGRNGMTVDLLVNNAGYGVKGPVAEVALEDQLGMIRLNIEALVHLTASLLPAMISRGSGAVLNVASTAAFQPGPGFATYYASKAFVLSWSEALGAEVEPSGITVTALCPGPTETGFQERAGVEFPEEVPGLARKLVMLDARAVAEAGLDGVTRKRPVVIPGAGNQAGTLLPRLAPRRVVTKVAKAIGEKL